MSETNNEPQALVFRGDDQVASGPNGARIVVEPGAYTVRVGSGPTPQMVSVAVDAQAGATTVVPVRWSGLRIEVVDESNLAHRGAYELIRVTDRQPFTVGFGADTLQGEQLRTLLMPPGLYRIVQPGANYRARTDFATVLAPEGALVHYKLVINPDDGRFRGAGVVLPAELGAVPELSPWSRRYMLGLSAPFGSTRNVVGANNENTFGTELFFDTYVTYQRDRDLFSGVFELESGFQKVRPEASAAIPWRKTHDRLRIDVLYSRFLNARVGPYVRFGLRTSLFESNMLVTEDTLISRQFNDGRRESVVVPANSTFPTGDAFSPPEYREGAGLNTRLLQGRTVRLDWRVGAGLRQNRFAGAFFLDDDETTSKLEYVEGDNFNEIGLETTLVATVRYRSLLYNANLDLFSEFAASDPSIDWRSTLSWRLTRELSLDYKIDLLRLPQVNDTDAPICQESSEAGPSHWSSAAAAGAAPRRTSGQSAQARFLRSAPALRTPHHFCKALERVRRARVARGRPEDPGAEACRVGDPLGGVVMTTRPHHGEHRPVPRHAGLRPAWRLFRRAGPLQRGRGRAHRRSMS